MPTSVKALIVAAASFIILHPSLSNAAPTEELCAIGPSGDAACGAKATRQRSSKEHLLLQMQKAGMQLSSIKEHTAHQRDPACDPLSIMRRRRNSDMCTCRRRNTVSAAGWKCDGQGEPGIDTMIRDDATALGTQEEREAIKFMSYNVMGWAGCNAVPDRGIEIFNKITSWQPAVLGAQEVETGGGRGWDECASKVSIGTGLEVGGGSQFFDANVVENHTSHEREILPGIGYWISMTRYQHKNSQAYFLFFNSHWQHGNGEAQAHEIAYFIDSKREEYNYPPSILVGDTNQFCRAYDLYAYQYLTGQKADQAGDFSPVTFVDVLGDNSNFTDTSRSFGDAGDCRVDFILASAGQWSVKDAKIDRDGMGESGTASDHAALMAELAPLIYV